MVNFELYRIFKIVADEENLTKASEILHISQPAVTKHIKNLENELDVELFKRSKYGMILNENGKKLYLQIRDSIDILSKADSIFNTHKDIKLGVHVYMPERIYNNGISIFYENNNNNIINNKGDQSWTISANTQIRSSTISKRIALLFLRTTQMFQIRYSLC